MRGRFVMALLGLAGVGALVAGASAQAPGQCTPQSIGLARTIDIETRAGPRFGSNQYQVQSPLKDGEVILTFDDGPHKAYTPMVLDALDAHCTKATFFMVGQRALLYPDLVRKVASRGHTIATHTWSHQNLAQISPEEARREVELGISAVQKALGQPAAPFFRFPYLSDPSDMRNYLKERNTGIFSIDVDSYDFRTRSPTVVIRNVMQQLDAKRRGIILFHDIQPSTAGALNQLLSELKVKGYRVVHMLPTRGQVTLGEYDKIADSSGAKRLASMPVSVPVAQRGVVSPAWEMQVFRGPQGNAPRPGFGYGGQYPPVQAPVEQPRRPPPRPDDDWRSSVFKQW